MSRLAPAVLILTLLVGCSTTEIRGQALPRTPESTIAVSPSTTAAPSDTIVGESCQGEEPLVEEGVVGAFTEPSDAGLLSSITWEDRGGCEVFVFRFQTSNGAPATTPPGFAALLRRPSGILRIELDVTDSLITRQLAESRFVSSVYVPVDESGSRFVDLILTDDVLARATTERSPGTIEIQLHSGGVPIAGSPTIADGIVVTEPAEGAVDSPTVSLAGYTTGEEVRIVNGETTDTTLRLRAEVEGAQPWTAFETEINLPRGDSVIEVIPQIDDTAIDGIAIEVERSQEQ